MEITIIITITMLALVLTVLIGYVLCCLVVFIGQEINHTARKMKRNIRDSVWDLEWKWKLFARRK